MNRHAFAVLVLLFALGACDTARELGSVAKSDLLSSKGVNADLRLQSDWGSGYCAEVTLQNTSSAVVASWTAVIDLHQSNLSQIWSGSATQSGSRIAVNPVSWNTSIAPGTSVAFGFCGNSSGSNYRPELLSISIIGGSGGTGGSGGSGGGSGGSGGGGSGGSGGGSGGSGGLPSSCPGICNSATPVYPTLSSEGGLGNVTMYSTSASSGGACNYGATNVMYYAAMSVNVQPGDGRGQWQAGRICGQCAEVTALTSQGPKSVVVRILDKCPDGHCGIDLGGSAPGAVMLNGAGRYDGKWRFVSCSGHPEVSDGSPSLTVVAGSNAWWSRVRVRNPTSAVESIRWQSTSGTASGSFPYATDPENAFEVPVKEVLQSTSASFRITVRYVDSSTATVQLSPSQLAAQNGAYPLN